MIAPPFKDGAASGDATLRALAVDALRELEARRWRLALAESCTGGWVAKSLTDIAGSSRNFIGGVVSYADSFKSAALAVAESLLAAYGAVSRETVLAMAAGVRRGSGADLALSVSGIAGPGGGSPEKPVGLVWFGLDGADIAPFAEALRFSGDREAVRRQAVAHALRVIAQAANPALHNR